MKILEKLDTVGIWGVTVTLAYLLTGLVNQAGFSGTSVNYSLILMWIALMSIPGYYSLQQYREDGDLNNLNVIWSAVIIVAVLANIPGELTVTGEILTYAYYHKWFLLPGALFAYTAYMMDGFSRKVYAVATVLNLGVAVSLSSVPLVFNYAFLIGAVVQGLPMLVDWYRFNIYE
jgi:hypothetical protein